MDNTCLNLGHNLNDRKVGAMAVLYKTDGTQESVKSKGKYFDYKELQQAVEGYIELICLHDGRHLYINEEGKMYNLPPNLAATALVDDILFDDDYIVGNAILLEIDEDDPGDEDDE